MPRLVVVLWVGALPAADLLAALEAQGIGVVLARDAAHAGKLLTHFQASAVVSADIEEVLSLPETATPLILMGAPTCRDTVPARALQVSEPIPQVLATMIKRSVRTSVDHSPAP